MPSNLHPRALGQTLPLVATPFGLAKLVGVLRLPDLAQHRIRSEIRDENHAGSVQLSKLVVTVIWVVAPHCIGGVAYGRLHAASLSLLLLLPVIARDPEVVAPWASVAVCSWVIVLVVCRE